MSNVGPPLFVLFPSLNTTLPIYIAYSHGHELYAERSYTVKMGVAMVSIYMSITSKHNCKLNFVIQFTRQIQQEPAAKKSLSYYNISQ
jgi:hypothetical protein